MGSGELTLRQESEKAMPTDISMRMMGALGVKDRVLDGSGASGVGLNVKPDAAHGPCTRPYAVSLRPVRVPHRERRDG